MIFILSNKKVSGAKVLKVIDIEFLNKDLNLLEYDALIFTSQNGVKAIDRIDKSWKNIPTLSIGKATSTVVKNLNGNLIFTANKFDGNSFAKEVVPILKNKKVLYIRAEKVISNLISILKSNEIDLIDMILYKTICSKVDKNFNIPNSSIIIFSSPSTIECFFKNFKWNKSYIAVAIGETTAKYLPKNINFFISNNQTIDGCIKFSQNLRLPVI